MGSSHHDGLLVARRLGICDGLEPKLTEAMIEEAPRIFFRPPYVGTAGWIGVEMAAIDDEWLGSLIREAFNLTSAKDRRTGPRKSSNARALRSARGTRVS